MEKLVECPLCGRKVSSKVNACPGCGHNVAKSIAKQEKAQWQASPEGLRMKQKYDEAQRIRREWKNTPGVCDECGTRGFYDADKKCPNWYEMHSGHYRNGSQACGICPICRKSLSYYLDHPVTGFTGVFCDHCSYHDEEYVYE